MLRGSVSVENLDPELVVAAGGGVSMSAEWASGWGQDSGLGFSAFPAHRFLGSFSSLICTLLHSFLFPSTLIKEDTAPGP